MNPACLSKD